MTTAEGAAFGFDAADPRRTWRRRKAVVVRDAG